MNQELPEPQQRPDKHMLLVNGHMMENINEYIFYYYKYLTLNVLHTCVIWE